MNERNRRSNVATDTREADEGRTDATSQVTAEERKPAATSTTTSPGPTMDRRVRATSSPSAGGTIAPRPTPPGTMTP